MADTILTERRDNILVITLDRPAVRNALSAGIRAEMGALLATVNADPETGAVVITGAGDKAFCGGQDLAEAQKFSAETAQAWVDGLRSFYQTIRDLDKPVVAAVNGVAAGAGIQIALLCDLRIGHAGSRMGQPEINAGLASVIGAHLLSLSLGHSRTVELALTGRLMDGAEAHRLGLLNELVAADEVLDRAVAVAGTLAAKPPGAMALTKQRFRDLTQPAFDATLNAAVGLQQAAYGSGEPQAVMAAFLARKRSK